MSTHYPKSNTVAWNFLMMIRDTILFGLAVITTSVAGGFLILIVGSMLTLAVLANLGFGFVEMMLRRYVLSKGR